MLVVCLNVARACVQEDVLLHWPERQSLFSQEKEGWTEDRLMALSNAPQLDDPELVCM